MDTALPVWTIRPNWAQSMTERLDWLTDVMMSDIGDEQRRSVRISPRRSFEYTMNPTRNERTYLDLMMHRLGSVEWLAPLWHDQAALSSGVVPTGLRLPIDNTFREFLDGGYALLFQDAFTWEIVSVSGQDDTGLDLDVAIDGTWPARTKVYPIRKMLIATDTKLSALTSRVGESQILFTVNDINDFPEVMPADLVYAGRPILWPAPDRSTAIDVSHVRLFDEQDGQIGLRYRTDDAGRAFAAQSHNWQITGREAQTTFRSMLYWLRGRQRSLWMPSFNDDIFISRPVAIGAHAADIEQIGLGYVGGGAIPGRSLFWTGSEVLAHTTMAAPASATEERINLAGATTAAYAVGDTWSFLQAARLDTDTIEITHHADSNGTFECGASFHTFADDRTAPAPIYVPVPTAFMSDGVCGQAEDATNPCRPVPFNGAYRMFLWFHKIPCNAAFSPTRNLSLSAEWQPNAPHGKAIQQFNNFAGPLVVYEKDDGVNPASPNFGDPAYANLRGQVLVSITTTNQSVTGFFYGMPARGAQLQVQYPAFYCGSVGLDHGTVAVDTCSVTEDQTLCIPIETLLGDIGGNFPYTYTWDM